jgi:APA family basic amino acid/polyamine antiporter
MPDVHRPYKVWGYPVIPAIFILFCIGLFFNTIITRPRESVIGLSLILSGIPVFYLLRRKYSKKVAG